ncbi:MAG TPA: hypothetical protein VK404_01325 [Spirosoma sp.]|nr:hypothetical protein [Spirosoma sp.]
MKRMLTHYRSLITGLLLLISCLFVRAQVAPEAQKRYKAAVQRVLTGDYARGKDELNALILQGGPLAPYASYYHALADFRQKNYSQSRLMLRQLMTRFPDWRKMDDVRYLLGAVCLETSQYEEALTNLQRISDPSLRTAAADLQQTFMSRLTDLARLKELNRQFPDNRPVGLALIDLIQRTASDKDDLELSDRLTNRFGVPGTVTTHTTTSESATTGRTTSTRPSVPVARPNRAKGYFNVAVMFPFRLDDFDADKRVRSNQYVYDLYDGIKLAKAKLQEEGITVNLFAYDVDNDANRTLELVNSPAFAQTDLIIGPLYTEPNRIVSAYANQNNMLLVNPIATSSDLVTNQPLSFLAQPSVSWQARKAAEQVRGLGGGIRRAAIYFGQSRKDSLLAAAYQAELKRQNYQILDFRKVSGSAQTMADAMLFSGTTTAAQSSIATPPPTSLALNHVFFASSNEDDGARMLDALSRRRVSGPLIATASAFDYYRNSTSTFTRRDLYLLYPDYIDTSREPVVQFQEEYVTKRNTIPSVFAHEGYDMMLFFGRQMAKNGVPFRSRTLLRTDPNDDYLLSGFDYSQTNENQVVPIVKYEGKRFTKIN